MANIVKRLHIDAPIDAVWAALADPVSIARWMEDPTVRLEPKIGGHYLLFGGETSGSVTEMDAPTLLEYTWRQINWNPDWPDSVVRWDLSPEGDGTRVMLTHSQFPNDDERDSHDEGWDLYWLDPMTEYLERDAI